MSEEDVKTYNKKYYEANKDVLLEKAKKKEECPFCHRVVYVVNMADHKLTKLCKRRETALIEDAKRKKVNELII